MAPMLSPAQSLIELLTGAPVAAVAGHRLGQADAFERDGALHLLIDLPGVARDDINLLVDEGSVTVRAERRMGPDPTDRLMRHERAYGSLDRTFTTQRPLDADAAAADLVDGVLSIVVPYADAKTGPRRITIGAADSSAAELAESSETTSAS